MKTNTTKIVILHISDKKRQQVYKKKYYKTEKCECEEWSLRNNNNNM